MTDYTPELHENLRELHEQASPAPWGDRLDCIIGSEDADIIPHAEYPVSSMTDEDRVVLVEARNALPVLLAEIERLQEELKIRAAEAWEEGYDSGRLDEQKLERLAHFRDPEDLTPNPYEED